MLYRVTITSAGTQWWFNHIIKKGYDNAFTPISYNSEALVCGQYSFGGGSNSCTDSNIFILEKETPISIGVVIRLHAAASYEVHDISLLKLKDY